MVRTHFDMRIEQNDKDGILLQLTKCAMLRERERERVRSFTVTKNTNELRSQCRATTN